MKRHLFFLGMLLATSSISFAQIAINQANFPRQGTFIDSVINASSAVVAAPTHGSGQTWDYSAVTGGNLVTVPYFDASSIAGFPNALNFRELNLQFQGLPIQSNSFERIDADGWHLYGRTIGDVTHSIAAVSGGANDSLRFVGGNYIYPGNLQQLKFPAAYQDQWTLNYQIELPFELSVAGFGLNKAPGINVSYHHQTREVVGEGTLVIPDFAGNASSPFDALLIKVVRTIIDSTFLGGSPAPPALMGAFGLVQGATVIDSFYVMYAPGFAAPVVNANINGNQVTSFFYRPGAAALGSLSTIGAASFDGGLTLSPNPVAPGGFVYLTADKPVSIQTAQITSLTGQIVHQENIDAQNEMHISWQIPAHLKTGIYMVHLTGQNGKPVLTQKIKVTR
jgi:hypothetical protein